MTTAAVDNPDLSWSPGMQLHSFIPLIPGIHYPPRQVCNEGCHVAPLTKSLDNFYFLAGLLEGTAKTQPLQHFWLQKNSY